MSTGQNLKQYQWKNRLLLLFGDESTSVYNKQKSIFSQESHALKERDILILKGTKHLERQLNLKNNFSGIILIGKDGGIKLEEPFVVHPKTIFALIDGMPMRRAEMKKAKG